MADKIFGVLPEGELGGRPGLDVLADIVAGLLPQPPMCRTLNYRLVAVGPGFAVFEGEPVADFYNPLGGVHGGWTATLLDSAMACAVHTMLPSGQGYTTVEFKLNCIRPISEATGRVRCEGRVLNTGRTIATSEGKLLDAAGKLLAHGTETCLVFPMPERR